MKIADFFIQLGLRADTGTLNTVTETVENLGKGLIGVQAAFVTAGYALDRFVAGTLSGVSALKNLNSQTGLSIEELQKWQQAGQLSNLELSADSVAQSIGNLQRSLASIRLGQGNIAPFQMLGIDVAGKNAFQVLNQIRNNIKGIAPDIQSNILSQMGIGPEMLPLLRATNEEFAQLSQNTFLSKEQRDKIYAVGLSFRELTLRMSALKDQAVAKIAPELERLIKTFFTWIKDNGEKITQIITNIANAFITFLKAVGNAFSLLGDFVSTITNAESGIKALSIAFAALGIAMMPFTAGLLLVIALLDDIKTWKEGGQSLFGNFYQGIATFVQKVTPLLQGIKQFFKDIVDLADSVGDKLGKVADAFGMGKNGIWTDIKNTLIELTKNMGIGAMAGSVVPGVGTAMGAAGGAGYTFLEKLFSNIKDFKGDINNNVIINVDGSQDPKATASAIQDHLNHAQSAINNGGR